MSGAGSSSLLPLESLLLPKNFAVQTLHGNSPRSNIKIRLSKMLRELNKYVTMRLQNPSLKQKTPIP